jgi:hypothetical protein
VRIWLNARELDSTSGLRAYFETNLHSDPDAHDAAGPVPFTLSPGGGAAPQFRVVRLTSEPSPPRAGKELVVGLAVEREDTGELVTHGAIRCAAAIGTKKLKTALRPHFFESLGAAVFGEPSQAICGWTLPRGSRGGTLDGSIGVRADGLQAGESFAFRIR